MKKMIIFIAIFLFSCGEDVEFSILQPSNPPVGLKMIRDGENFRLTFRSENRSNERFGGFLIYVAPDENTIIEIMKYTDYENMEITEKKIFIAETDYIVGILNENENDSGKYNPGIETEIEILFDDANLSKERIIPGSWLTLRAYLVDKELPIVSVSPMGDYAAETIEILSNMIVGVSTPGNPVEIP